MDFFGMISSDIPTKYSPVAAVEFHQAIAKLEMSY